MPLWRALAEAPAEARRWAPVAHHEGELAAGGAELRCGSYDPSCAGCRGAWEQLRWTPEAAS